MNAEIGAEAALFPEKEYINGTAIVVYDQLFIWWHFHKIKFITFSVATN